MSQQAQGSSSLPSAAKFLSEIRSHERVVVVVEGAFLYHTARQLQFDVNFAALRQLFFDHCPHFVRCTYFATLLRFVEEGQQQQPNVPMQRVVDWLQFNGWDVYARYLNTVRNAPHPTGANFYVDISMSVVSACEFADHIVLIAGDESYESLINYAKLKGKRITVCGSLEATNNKISDTLRRAADTFIELSHLKPFIEKTREHKERRDEGAVSGVLATVSRGRNDD